MNIDNTITYTPDSGWVGTDPFDYPISDGRGGTDTGAVEVTVHEVSVPPHEAEIPIPGTGVILYFMSLMETNTLSAVPVAPGSQHGPVPSYRIVPGTYYDITTTAVFTGEVLVTITYNDSGLTAEQEAGLRLYHWEGGAWVDVTVSRDTVANTVTRSVTSFSDFVIMAPPPSLPPPPPGVTTSASSPWSIALLVISALGVAVGQRLRKRTAS